MPTGGREQIVLRSPKNKSFKPDFRFSSLVPGARTWISDFSAGSAPLPIVSRLMYTLYIIFSIYQFRLSVYTGGHIFFSLCFAVYTVLYYWRHGALLSILPAAYRFARRRNCNVNRWWSFFFLKPNNYVLYTHWIAAGRRTLYRTNNTTTAYPYTNYWNTIRIYSERI